MRSTAKVTELSWKPKGIILSGGPWSIYEEGAPILDPAVFELEIPILGICYGLQAIAWHFAKNVILGDKREYGYAIVSTKQHRLFDGLGSELEVWMSHGDKLSSLPPSFLAIATTDNAPFAGIASLNRPIFGIQFHPEVAHTPKGTKILRNFAVGICEARQHWTMEEFVSKEINRIRALVGEKGQVIGAVSGGVDSTVAAKLMHEAIGDRFHAVFVNNGLLRDGEVQEVQETLTSSLGIQLTVVDASQRFLDALVGQIQPEMKRKIIGRIFIEVFQEAGKKLEEEAAGSSKAGDIEWLLQGTLYPDVIESISFKGPSQTIKTHHNVGGLPAVMRLKLIEPLRELFKDEVRVLGATLDIPQDLLWRHPFPGPGLAIRVIGKITNAQLSIVREADKIFIDAIRAAGLYLKISQAFAALLGEGVKAVGVVGDNRCFKLRLLHRTGSANSEFCIDLMSNA
ncbi:MAG: GMP synthase (glutamine-hydrolyzing) [Alectoria fallacina]|uniref:GMP synthase (glutamine-hydrolyzing) n=1 Tax=Alectoria fallacina TaxID=1903189 RepID=A0A8H3FGZ4_9LECA|nr:MAG: GMP synthase (glutamine-hydrolyzing) [Alectoria fallacina]